MCRFLKHIALSALLTIAFPNLIAAQEITPHKITESIYMLEGQGGNIGLSIGDDGVLLVDTQFAKMSDKIGAAINEIYREKTGDGIKGGTGVDYIINTHFHGDHTGGNAPISLITGISGGNSSRYIKPASILAHENVRKRMADGKDQTDPKQSVGLPAITYADKVTVHFNREDIQLLHLPSGHTDSDTVVYFPKANVLHVGDLLFNGFFPFVDTKGGGNIDQYMKNHESIIATFPGDVTIIPGHGPLATINDIKASSKIMRETIAIIRKGMKAGKSLEELQKEGLPKKYDSAGTFFIKTPRWINIVYDSYNDN